MTSTPTPAPSSPLPPTLLTLPLEVRLLIYRHALPQTVTADCCEQASFTLTSTNTNTSHRRLSFNPYYPPPIPGPSAAPTQSLTSTSTSPKPPTSLPPFTLPTPHLPLRLTCHPINTDLLTHILLPPLTARVCDFLCLRRALSLLSRQSPSHPSHNTTAHHHHHKNDTNPRPLPTAGPVHPLTLRHITAVHVSSERVLLPRAAARTRTRVGRSVASLAGFAGSVTEEAVGEEALGEREQEEQEEVKRARVARLARSYVLELRRYWREVGLGSVVWSAGVDGEEGDGEGDEGGLVGRKGKGDGAGDGVTNMDRGEMRTLNNEDPVPVGVEMVFEVQGLLRGGLLAGDQGGVVRLSGGTGWGR